MNKIFIFNFMYAADSILSRAVCPNSSLITVHSVFSETKLVGG